MSTDRRSWTAEEVLERGRARQAKYAKTGDWMDLHDFEMEVCPHCGFERRWEDHPVWAKEPGVIFAHDGAVYRAVVAGWGNGGRYYPHTHAFLRVVPIDAEPWMGLPAAPCAKADVGLALSDLFRLPAMGVWDLDRAIHLVRLEEKR